MKYSYNEEIDDVIAKKKKGSRPEIDSIYIRVGADIKEKAIPFFDKKHQPIEIQPGKPKTFYHQEAAFYINRNSEMESYLVSSGFEYPEGVVDKVGYIDSLIAGKAKMMGLKTEEIKVIEHQNQVYILSCSSGIEKYFHGYDSSIFGPTLIRVGFSTEPKELIFHGTNKEIIKYSFNLGNFKVNEPLYFGEHFDALKNFIEGRLQDGLIVVFEDSTNATFPGNAGLIEETKAMSTIFGNDPNFIAVKYSSIERGQKIITPIINGIIEENEKGLPVFTIPNDIKSLEELKETILKRKNQNKEQVQDLKEEEKASKPSTSISNAKLKSKEKKEKGGGCIIS